MHELDILLEEYKQLVGTCRDYFGFYFRTFILYFAVVGVLLKLFFDSKAHSDERFLIFLAGGVINVGVFAGSFVARRYYLTIASRFKVVTEKLSIPDVYFPGTIATAKLCIAAVGVLMLMWLLLVKYL